jgi:S1-C subfamily serine protease
MRLSRFTVLSSLTVVLLAPSARPTFAQFTTERLDVVKKSVVRVECLGRSATGFFWRQNDWVVTALHVVSGCNSIVIFSEVAGNTSTATVVKALRAQDLALLQLAHNLNGTGLLEVATQTPTITEDLETLGYPLAIPKMESTTLRIRYGGRQLKDIVPKAVADELKALGSPSPEIEITDIEGHLLPGHSGAPILNSSGKVVAIADGGLESGAVGASWGLPTSNLAKLPSSTDSTAIPTGHSSHLFAAETEAQNGPDITCGGGTFKKIRTLDFQDILHATDDPLGLEEILNAAGPVVASFKYDVYQHASTGATFVVPAGANVTSNSGMCVASSGDIVIQIAMIRSGPNDPIGQQAAVRYEQTIVNPQGWQPDPAWSYLTAVNRFDGFVVRRKSFVHYGMYANTGWMMDAYLFETLVDRGGVFLGASVLNRKWTPQIMQLQQACKINPQVSPYCQQALEHFVTWVQAAIGVHLATFPIG